MKTLELYMEKILNSPIAKSIIVILISVLLYKVLMKIFIKNEDRKVLRGIDNNKRKTYLKMTRSIIRYIIIIVTALIILQINGVDVSSMLAGVGIASVIIGFAIQDVLKDIIKGLDIISDKYFQVGDVVKYGDIEGKVLIIGLKTTKIKDIKTENIISIANRNIQQVEIVSNIVDAVIPMPYEVEVPVAEKVIKDIMKEIENQEHVENCTYLGVLELSESSVKYLITMQCKPEFRRQVRRDAQRCILLGLEDKNIKVPYNQIVVHTK